MAIAPANATLGVKGTQVVQRTGIKEKIGALFPFQCSQAEMA